MSVRFFILCSLFYFCISCEFVSKKNAINRSAQVIDTMIDVKRVDVFPSFKTCDTLLAVPLKNSCFTKELHKHLTASLLLHTFTVSKSIDEVVRIQLKIDNQGRCELMQIISSKKVQKMLPELDNVIRESVERLPTLFPALKRGIPVTSIYEIPIVVKID
jgi:hypothetical protein